MSNQVKTKAPVVNNRIDFRFNFLLLPLFLITIILPLITKLHIYDTRLSSYDWFSTSGKLADFYLYYKQWFFVFICGFMLLILIIEHYINKRKLKFQKTLLPLIIYAILALLSTFFSDHIVFGISGIWEQFENVFCLLGYVLIVYYMYQIVKSEEETRTILNYIAVGALIIGIIGTLETFGVDIVRSFINSGLIVEDGYTIAEIEKITGSTVITLFNPNYVGVYTSMMFTIFLTQLIGTKKIFERILYSLVVLTMLISLYGSQSKTGIISIVISMIVVILIYRKKVIKLWYITVPFVLLIVISTLLLSNITNDNFLKEVLNAITIQKDTKLNLTELYTEDDKIILTYKNNTIKIQENELGYLEFTDSMENVIPSELYSVIEENVPVITPQDDRFSGILIADYTDKDEGICVQVDGVNWLFKKDHTSNKYLYFNHFGRFSSIRNPESCFLEDYSSFATGRGYIWSRTIPLLRNHIILGSGADSFIFEFPQDDYLGLYHNGFATSLMTKPHNWFLQIGVQTGVLSLICILVFFGIYIVQSIRLYMKSKPEDSLSMMGASIFIGIICYLVSAISNDSSITIAPVFWVITGLGYVINRRIKEKSV